MEISGKCPSGHIVKTQTNDPIQFYLLNPVKTICPTCNALVGCWWSSNINAVSNDWAVKYMQKRR